MPNEPELCPICGPISNLNASWIQFHDRPETREYNCPACGKFEFLDPDKLIWREWQGTRHLLSSLIRRHNVREGRPYRYTDRGGQKLPSDLEEPSFATKCSMVLGELYSRTAEFGKAVDLDLRYDWSLLRTASSTELRGITSHLVKSALVEDLTGSHIKGTPFRFVVTGSGMEEAARSAEITRDTTSSNRERKLNDKTWDLFLSHASEDKEFVIALHAELTGRELEVWFDTCELTLGDSLPGKIDEGLRSSRFGVVVLSDAFFAKGWPQAELDALLSREIAGAKVILPITHNMTIAQLGTHSPLLARKLTANTDLGVEAIADQIQRAVGRA